MVTLPIMKITIITPTLTLLLITLLLILIPQQITQQIPLLTILRIIPLQIQQIQLIIRHRSTLQEILSVLVKSALKNITSLQISPVYNAPLPNPTVSHAI